MRGVKHESEVKKRFELKILKIKITLITVCSRVKSEVLKFEWMDDGQRFTLHFQASGLFSCSCFILFPSQSHHSSPITTHTTDST